MLTHEDIWRAIDALANSRGYSPSGLARRAGLDATSFNPSKRIAMNGKPRWPSTESLAKALAAADCSLAEFLGFMGEHGSSRHIPLIPLAATQKDAMFDERGQPTGDDWDEIELPGVVAEVRDPGLYALKVTDDEMQPTYRKGDVMIVSPSADTRAGQRALVRFDDGAVAVRELAGRTQSEIELATLNGSRSLRRVPAASVLWMARILWVSQ